MLKTTMAEALVIPVNTMGVIGKGIAGAWAKQARPADMHAYEARCERGQARLGHVWTTERHGPNVQTAIFFPVKGHHRERSTLEAISEGLVSLHALITKDRIKSIAVPALGCEGAGGLDWPPVRAEIRRALTDLNCEIYVFPPPPPGKK